MLSLVQLLGTNDDHLAKNEKEANKEEKKKSVVIDDGMWWLNSYCIVSFIHKITTGIASLCQLHNPMLHCHWLNAGSKVEQHSTVIHNKDKGIILEELKEDVKCMKLQWTALTGLVTETMHKGVASMITELLTTLKSDILQEIVKSTTGMVPNIPFAHQEVPNTPSTHQGSTIHFPHTKQSLIALSNTKETPIALWHRMDSSISLRLK